MKNFRRVSGRQLCKLGRRSEKDGREKVGGTILGIKRVNRGKTEKPLVARIRGKGGFRKVATLGGFKMRTGGWKRNSIGSRGG